MSASPQPLSTVSATRYLTPLREGGSLPAIVDTDGDGLYVVKFRGAGQGAKALIAEVIVGLLARELGLPVPDLAVVDMAEDFGRTEPDPEIQDILVGSRGANFGIRYLEGALNFDPVAAADLVSQELATDLVWLDALTTNPDRSHKNPNLLVWEGHLWLIDHGAALYPHHNWSRVDDTRTRTRFPGIEQHVFVTQASDLEAADERHTASLDEATVTQVLDAIPDSWLTDSVGGSEFATATEGRARYLTYLMRRLEGPRDFVTEAASARDRLLASPPGPLSARR